MQKVRAINFPVYTHDSGTISNSAVAISSITGRQGAFITIEDAAVRYRMDGTAPTSTTGHILFANQSLLVTDPTSLGNLKLIRKDGTDATYQASLF